MTAKEIYKQVKINRNYEVSNYGNVRNKKTGRLLTPSISNKGYYLVALSDNCKQKTITIHKLVLDTFVGNDNKSLVIDHKDGNKLNNYLYNLEYTTQENNVKRAWSGGLCENVRNQAKNNILKASEANRLPVIQLDQRLNIIKIWDSIREAGRSLNINNANIVKCCKKKRQSAGGFIWRYYNEQIG